MTPIGAVCQSLGITARALRYYDVEGLVPAGRDRRNRRVFSADARHELEIVALLRGAGVPLEEVRWVLQAARRGGRPALVRTATDCLTYRLGRLAAEQLRAEQALEWINRDLGAPGDTATSMAQGAGISDAEIFEDADRRLE